MNSTRRISQMKISVKVYKKSFNLQTAI